MSPVKPLCHKNISENLLSMYHLSRENTSLIDFERCLMLLRDRSRKLKVEGVEPETEGVTDTRRLRDDFFSQCEFGTEPN